MKKFHSLVAFLLHEAALCNTHINKHTLYVYAIDLFSNQEMLEYVHESKGH